jgi:hypothetical protein
MHPIKWSLTCFWEAWIIVAWFDTTTTIASLDIIHKQGCFGTPTVNDVLLYRDRMHVHRCRKWTRIVGEVLENSVRGIALLESLDNFVQIPFGLAKLFICDISWNGNTNPAKPFPQNIWIV